MTSRGRSQCVRRCKRERGMGVERGRKTLYIIGWGGGGGTAVITTQYHNLLTHETKMGGGGWQERGRDRGRALYSRREASLEKGRERKTERGGGCRRRERWTVKEKNTLNAISPSAHAVDRFIVGVVGVAHSSRSGRSLSYF